MKNFLKNIDVSQIQDRVSELKNQVEELRLQKPWRTNKSSSPLMLLALGLGLAAVGVTLYKKRSQVAKLCNKCGDEIKDKMNSIKASDFSNPFSNSQETPTHI